MQHYPAIYRTETLDVTRTSRSLEELGYSVFVFPGHGVDDGTSFYDAVRATCPLDPPLIGSETNWDALDDSLIGGLVDLDVDRVALLWPKATTMATSAPSDFLTAVDVLTHVVNTLSEARFTANHPKQLIVLLELEADHERYDDLKRELFLALAAPFESSEMTAR